VSLPPDLDLGRAGLLVGGAYLAGSITFGPVFARLRGVDLRAVGSGNIGATNTARALGRPLGVVVMLLDAAKGALPVLAAARWLGEPPAVVALVGLAAVLGHLFPVFLRFRGGKGVATGLGVFLALAPLAALGAAALWLLVYGAARLSSLASLVAAVSLPIGLLLLGVDRTYLALAVTVVGIILVRHRGNIGRLAARSEHRL
jgi:acyl phosphate:glycerol-3-phosphate acyltransferase